MEDYTVNEYVDMHLMYGECECNGAEAARRDRRGGGRPQRHLDVEEEVLERVEDDPMVSCRELERATGCPKSTVSRILRDNSLHRFHYTKVQKLEPGDAAQRLHYSQEFLALYYRNENFLSQILWTDESLFTREGIFNQHNLHNYGVENPHLGGRYYTFLTERLTEMLDDIPIASRPQWFQQDGAPPHSARQVSAYLNLQFPGRSLGCFGSLRWPARSPDLTPLDFFLWGYLKEQVYKTEPETAEDLVARLHAAVTNVDPEKLRLVRMGVLRRIHACVAAGGGHFQQLPT
ncbi:uncharacterized protein LOC107046257 [Diachasma alloeum]|uniref:uncharacterized protein LOC107046257 n=1 Tax=Diachasma alloeum TaxID=454923 RepID=UPI000738338F|nr:uncharacterized protein LOC107046257 [Diachasma alloeum]